MNTENQPQPDPDPAPAPEAPQPTQPEKPVEFGELPDSAKQNAMLCHLLGALVSVIGALVMWLVKKDEHPFIDDQGKEATNFQITIVIAYLALSFIGTVLAFISCGILFFAPLLGFVPWPIQIIFGIIGAMKAKEGEAYRYPFALRLIK